MFNLNIENFMRRHIGCKLNINGEKVIFIKQN